MATTANKPKTTAKTKVADVLDSFKSALTETFGVFKRTETAHVLSRVLFAGVLASMYDAVDEEIPALKESASQKEKSARREKIQKRVLDYVEETVDAVFTWSTVSAWIDAARVNATLPEHLQVRLDGELPTGYFSVYPLRALGRIDNLEDRVKLAEDLVKSGDLSQEKVEAAVKGFLGESNVLTTVKPKMAKTMVEDTVKKLDKNDAKVVGIVQALTAQMADKSVAIQLIDFGRLAWLSTPSDPAVEDKTKREAKRLRVFRDVVTEIANRGTEADENDGSGAEDDAS